MDAELLKSLSDIKLLLVSILVVTSVSLFLQLIKLISRFVTKRTIYREKVFNHLAAEHFDKGEYEELIRYSEEKLKSWGRNPHALYWLARTNQKQGNIQFAKQLFEEIENSEPEWKDIVQPYLTEINETLTST